MKAKTDIDLSKLTEKNIDDIADFSEKLVTEMKEFIADYRKLADSYMELREENERLKETLKEQNTGNRI